MNFRGLKLNKRTKITCLVLLAVDLLLVLSMSNADGAAGVFRVAFFALIILGISGIIGLFLLFYKPHRIIGLCLLGNILALPCYYIISGYIYGLWYEYWIMGEDIKYEMDYNGSHKRLILYGERHANYESRKEYNGDKHNSFKITDYYSFCDGKYKQIGENHYMLICDFRDLSEINCKDTLILHNDTLYNYFDKPVKVVKK